MWDLTSLTRDWTHVACNCRWICNHRTTEEIPHFSFDLHFPNDEWCWTSCQCTYWPFMYLFQRNVCSNALLIFELSFFVCMWLNFRSSPYILNINLLSDIWFAKTFSHPVGCLFYFVDIVFQCTQWTRNVYTWRNRGPERMCVLSDVTLNHLCGVETLCDGHRKDFSSPTSSDTTAMILSLLYRWGNWKDWGLPRVTLGSVAELDLKPEDESRMGVRRLGAESWCCHLLRLLAGQFFCLETSLSPSVKWGLMELLWGCPGTQDRIDNCYTEFQASSPRPLSLFWGQKTLGIGCEE